MYNRSLLMLCSTSLVAMLAASSVSAQDVNAAVDQPKNKPASSAQGASA